MKQFYKTLYVLWFIFCCVSAYSAVVWTISKPGHFWYAFWQLAGALLIMVAVLGSIIGLYLGADRVASELKKRSK